MTDQIYVADTETTGFKEPVVPIQLAFMRLEGPGPLKHTVVETGDVLFDPGRHIEYGAMAAHGITNQMVKGREPWAKFRWGAQPDYLIGHQISYDWGVMQSCLTKNKLPKFICTLALARAMFPADCDSHKLGALMHYIMDRKLLPKGTAMSAAKKWMEGAHEALADVRMSLCVLQAVAQMSKVNDWATLADISRFAVIPTVMPFGKHKDEKIEDIPGDYKAWALGPKGMTDLQGDLKTALQMSRDDWAERNAGLARLLK